MPFIINEDDALKKHLTGMTVSDQNDNARKVKVYFRLPEAEERRISYPYVTIDLLDVLEERDRAHRGIIESGYTPEGYEDPGPEYGQPTEFPVPVSLLYQITTHTRSAWHDRQLMAQMYGNRLPLRFGALDVPADDTVRRLDFEDMVQADSLDQDNKRVFRKAYTVTVSAELFPFEILAVRKADRVSVDVERPDEGTFAPVETVTIEHSTGT